MLQASSATVSYVLGQTNAAGIGIIRQCFMNVPQYVLVKVQLVIRFQASLSHIHLQPVRGCAMLITSKKFLDKREEGLLTSHLNKLGGFLTCLLQDCLSEYTSLVVSTVNGKVAGNITSIFCHSVTCLGTNPCCWDMISQGDS